MKRYEVWLAVAIIVTYFILRLFISVEVVGGNNLDGPDELLYVKVGQSYIEGILRWDQTVFTLNPEHPAFAKLLLGFLIKILEPLGLTPIFVSRFLGALLGALTGVVVFIFGRQLDVKHAIIPLALFTIDPIGYFLSTAILDVTYAFWGIVFLVAYYSFTKFYRRRMLLLSGIFLGLAISSKLTAVMLAATPLLWMTIDRERKVSFKQILVLVGISALTFVVVNPLMWNSSTVLLIASSNIGQGNLVLPGFPHYSLGLEAGVTADKLFRLLNDDFYDMATDTAFGMIYSPLILLTCLDLVRIWLRRSRLSREAWFMLLPGMWLFFFVWIHPKTFPYYWLPISPFFALFLALRLQKVVNRPQLRRSFLSYVAQIPIYAFFLGGIITPVLALQTLAVVLHAYPTGIYIGVPWVWTELDWLDQLVIPPLPIVLSVLQLALGTFFIHKTRPE